MFQESTFVIRISSKRVTRYSEHNLWLVFFCRLEKRLAGD